MAGEFSFSTFLARSMSGWKNFFRRLPGGSRMPLPLALFLVWIFLFAILYPLFNSLTGHVIEWRAIGSVSDEYPRRVAFVTLVTGPSYVRGARVLAFTLRQNNERDFPLVALEVGLSETQRQELRDVGWEVRSVQSIPFFPPSRDPLRWRWKPDGSLGATHVNALTKMRIWAMEEFDRLVFIDADAWAVADVCSHLCRRTEELVAMGDTVTDLNSGVMSLRPSRTRFDDMMRFWAEEPEKFFLYRKNGRPADALPNPDQALIIGYVTSRRLNLGPLSTRYNLNGRMLRSSSTRIIHFNVGEVKPWTVTRAEATDYLDRARKKGSAREIGIWSNIGDWLSLEDQVNALFPRRPEEAAVKKREAAEVKLAKAEEEHEEDE